MMAALPDKAPAKPKRPRKVLVLCKAAGFVHSSIPVAAATIEALGKKTGAWSTTISYDSAVITADNLKQYDALFLNNTTGAFLDDPNDAAVTEMRKKALLDFVRGGKGLAGIHAASDAYHTSGGRGRGAPPPEGAAAAPAGPRGTWPEFNKMIGGFFKFHWNDPQLITVKIDDPKSPLTAMFHGKPFEIRDETYTFAQDSFSRENVHVLTSVDYSRMSEEDKAKEPAATKRTDGDYALSWIRREGKGRVFYEAHGHSERVYAIRPMLEHILAGVQYAIGDLKANDRPSVRSKTN
jgi:type 1 glutamine amidotransferase